MQGIGVRSGCVACVDRSLRRRRKWHVLRHGHLHSQILSLTRKLSTSIGDSLSGTGPKEKIHGQSLRYRVFVSLPGPTKPLPSWTKPAGTLGEGADNTGKTEGKTMKHRGQA